MIVELPDTTTAIVGRKLLALREAAGLVTSGRVLTLVVCAQAAPTDDLVSPAMEAAREHPCRIIVLTHGDLDSRPRLDARLSLGGDIGVSEILTLCLNGELARHEHSVVIPFLLPDTPVVVWWPGSAPEHPASDPVGRLATRRITDATLSADPMTMIKSRLRSYTPGDTDMAWARVTYWRALLASALDEPPHEAVESVVVCGPPTEPAIDLLAGWLAARLDCPVRRLSGEVKAELVRESTTISLSRPAGSTAGTLRRTGQPDTIVALARRETGECLAEDLRRLDADEIYESALTGLEKVSYE